MIPNTRQTRESGNAPNQPSASVVMGIDPGLQRTGYAFLEIQAVDFENCRLIEAGIVRLDRKAPMHHRLVELEESIKTLIDAHRPSLLACEELYAHYKHPRTAILMGHARGVILALGVKSGMMIESVPATHAKKLLTGSGHATKVQMQRAVQNTLRLPVLPEPNDVADAIAIGLCGATLRHSALYSEANGDAPR